jgi:hypothetical protein
MQKKLWILPAIIGISLCCSSFAHADEEFIKKVGAIQATNGEVLFNLVSPDDAGTQCFFGQLRIQANQVGKDQMLSLLITAKSTQRGVNVVYAPASGLCVASSITIN